MQIVEYTEAVDLTMHGMHDDIYVMHPMAISGMTMQEVRAAAEAGAVFAVMKQPQKEPETKEEVKPTPPPEKPCWTGQEEEAGHWKDEGASRGRMVVQKDYRRNELQRSDGLEFL